MASVKTIQLFNTAMARLKSGRRDEAVGLLQQVLVSDPRHADALLWLGTIASMASHHEEAVDLLGRAIAIKPDSSPLYCTLGISLGAMGRLKEAIAAYQRAIALQPGNAEAQINLGCALVSEGQFEPAAAALRSGLALRPKIAEAHLVLSIALRGLRRFDEAIAAARADLSLRPNSAGAMEAIGLSLMGKGRPDLAIEEYRRALSIEVRSFETHLNLAMAYKWVGRFDDAIASYQAAINLRPDIAGLYNDMGDTLREMDRSAEAAAAWRQAIALDPRLPEVHNNLGIAASMSGQFDQGITSFRKALDARSTYPEAWINLGNAYKDTSRIDEALECYDRAIALRPANPGFHSSRLFALHFHPDLDATALLREHQQWNQRHAAPLAAGIKPHRNSRVVDRRIRIGYVSPDFHEHVVGFSLLPLLLRYDRKQFEIYCYSNTLKPDAVTSQLRRHSDHWKDIRGLGDQHVAENIRADEIDILVDLSLHSAQNRLPIFAYKPAPVQVSYLGYCSTTGMDAMDYRFSDVYIDPPGSDVSCYSEQTIRLAGTYWCYAPTEPRPDVAPLPALAAGSITFGCLNNFSKVSQATQNLWTQLLQAVPNSRLLVHVPIGNCSERFRQRFESAGISRDRLELVPRLPWNEYISIYHRIDIALDPFPYGGGITTLDGMFMGVPVVTLNGQTAVGRGGCSVLSHVGLPDLIAQTPRQYIEIATALAGDLPRLEQIRMTLRDRMRQSALMDIPRFALDMEAAFREIWRRWCEKNQA
jgi:protein O-GlcNAc transferase